MLHYIAGKRLAAGRRTVVDATNVQQDGRRQLIELARKHDVLPIAIVLDAPRACAPSASRPAATAPTCPAGDPAPHPELAAPCATWSARASASVHVLRGAEEVEHATVVI
ncbi:hypothetical protein GCM10023238_07010 [Streptomyces heliomycini]